MSANWHKMIYYKQCNDSASTEMDNDIVHNYHIGNLEQNGWTRVISRDIGQIQKQPL